MSGAGLGDGGEFVMLFKVEELFTASFLFGRATWAIIGGDAAFTGGRWGDEHMGPDF